MNTRKSIIGSFYLTLQPLILSAIGLPATAYVIRSLGPTGYGQWVVATSLVGVFGVLTTMGLRPLFQRLVAQDPEIAHREAYYQLSLRGLLGIIAAAISICICLLLHYPRVVLICTLIAAVAMILSAMSSVFEDLMNGHQCFKILTIVSTCSGIILTLLSVVAVFYGGGPSTVALAYASGPLISLALFIVITHKTLFKITIAYSLTKYIQLLKDSRLVSISFILASIRDRVEGLFMPKMVGITQVGLFSAGALLPSRLGIIPGGIVGAFYAQTAISYKENPDEASLCVGRVIMLTLVCCLPLSMLMTFLSTNISNILFKTDSESCSLIIRLLAWTLPLSGVLSVMGTSLQAANHHDDAARAGIGMSLCSVPASLILIDRFGLMGACISSILRPIIGYIMYTPSFIRIFHNAIHEVPILRIIMCLVLMAVILTEKELFIQSNIGLLIISLISLLAYFCGIILFRIVSIGQIRILLSIKIIENSK